MKIWLQICKVVTDKLSRSFTSLSETEGLPTRKDKDLGVKAKIYARNGIDEYWIVNLKDKKLIVFSEPVGDRYDQAIDHSTEKISPQAFPNLEISLSQILLY